MIPFEYERIDFQNHSTVSDGALTPRDLVRHAHSLGVRGLALTEHVYLNRVENIVDQVLAVVDQAREYDVLLIPGVEVSLVPPDKICEVAKRAKQAGAKFVAVHGESLMGGTPPGTNLAAAQCQDVDMIGHPGFLDIKTAENAAHNSVYLELSGRSPHSLTNGHVARLAQEFGVKLLINSDTHKPDDLMTPQRAAEVARGAGLNDDEVSRALITNVELMLARCGIISPRAK
jgi:putative hydrolase